MKQLLSFLLFQLPLFSFAQVVADITYHPFMHEGKVWNCQSVFRGTAANFSLVLLGDSVVDGRTYHKMYREENGVRTLSDDGLWREQDRRVYVYANGAESLRYDFSMVPGQHADTYGVTTTLLEIDTVEVNGSLFRRFHVSPDEVKTDDDKVWIEGVGHPYGPFGVWGLEVNDGVSYSLRSCYEDGQCIFKAEDFTKTAYQSVDGIDSPLSTPRLRSQGMLFDLQGRRVQEPHQQGIYIKDGKKVVVR